MAVPEYLLIHDVVIVEPTATKDAYGNTDLQYGDMATRKTIRGWMQQDMRQLVSLDGGAPLVGGWLLVTNDTEISRRARVEWDGIVFELDGQPGPAFAMGGLHHAELTLRVVDG